MPEGVDALRPGIAGGCYPERDAEGPDRFERAFASLSAALGRIPESRQSLEAFVGGVRALQARLRDQPDRALDLHVERLRASMSVEGTSDALLPRAFALVCEVVRRRQGIELRDVQIMGGRVMARGMLAEMATGEGKTLTATLPACAAALAGIPVHVVSANDYLVERDATALRPVYEALGLRVGFVVESMRDASARRAAYACDVCYVTGKQLGFDYLRDRLVRAGRGDAALQPRRDVSPDLLLRGLCFAIIDEADSILIDEARTPLILAGGEPASEQDGLYRNALELARALEEGQDFRVERAVRRVELTDHGEQRLAVLAEGRPGIWAGPRRRREWVARALSALHLYERDRHYLVRDGRVDIIDASTGRASPGRSWSEGLHQLVELKEGCTITAQAEPLARMSYQHFFRRYLRLSGMSGTLREVAPELCASYGLATVRIPTFRPSRVVQLPTQVWARGEDRWPVVVQRVLALRAEQRPVLIGTASLEASQRLSALLVEAGVPHELLDARNDAREARVVGCAGEAGRITVATRLAGRGTDIPLAQGVAERGGLHVIVTECAEARRIDRQLQGRCGRQGDPGSFEILLGLDEGPLAGYLPARLVYPIGTVLCRPHLTHVAVWLTKIAQRAEERSAARERRDLLTSEVAMEELLVFSGAAR
jgi:preprotein translocase subunit SecA